MPLNKIFTSTPTFGADDIVGRGRAGQQIQGRPIALSEWRFTTGDPAVASAVAELFGGEPQKWETQSDEALEVLSTTAVLPVELTGLTSEFVLWGRSNKPIRTCNGATQNDDSKNACVCPSDLREHKEAAKAGTACQPSVRALFRLSAAPDLGLFRFNSASWQLAEAVNELEADLADRGGSSEATLALELVEYETKLGRQVRYTKPVIQLAPVAVAA